MGNQFYEKAIVQPNAGENKLSVRKSEMTHLDTQKKSGERERREKVGEKGLEGCQLLWMN